MIQTSSAVDNFYITEDVKNTPSRSKNVDEETEFLQRVYGALLISVVLFTFEVARERRDHSSDASSSILHEKITHRVRCETRRDGVHRLGV